MAKCVQCGRKLPPFSFGKRTCQWCDEYEAVQRGEIAEDAVQKVMPAPWLMPGSGRVVTQVIFGINVAVFVGMLLAGVSVTEPTTQELLHWGANSARLTLAGEWWRLVTSMFLHIGIIHIALNMWCLWSLGTLCESLYGPWMYAAVYLISGVSGSLASIAWHPYGVSAGASGAIFGIAGALVASYKFGEFSASQAFIASRLSSLVGFVAYNFIFGAISGTTDNAAHLGGLGAGAVMGALIARGAPQRDATSGRVAIVIFGVLAVFGAGFWLERARGFEFRVRRVDQLIYENKPAEAIPELQKIIRQSPKLASAHFALAHAYYSLKQYPQAEVELKRVLELEPQHKWANYELGLTYLDENRVGEAKAIFQNETAKNSNNADAHFGLGLALAQEQNYNAAIQEFNTAVRLDPESEGVYLEMGNSYAKLKQYDDAIAAYRKEQQQNGDNPDIENALTDAYQAKGMTAKAQEARQKAAQMTKKDVGN